MGLQRVGHDWATKHSLLIFAPNGLLPCHPVVCPPSLWPLRYRSERALLLSHRSDAATPRQLPASSRGMSLLLRQSHNVLPGARVSPPSPSAALVQASSALPQPLQPPHCPTTAIQFLAAHPISAPQGSLLDLSQVQITSGNLWQLVVALEGSQRVYHSPQGRPALLGPHCDHPPSLCSPLSSHTDFSAPQTSQVHFCLCGCCSLGLACSFVQDFYFYLDVDYFWSLYWMCCSIASALCFAFSQQGTWDLSSQTKDQTRTLFCIGRQSLNHWTTTDVLVGLFLKFSLCSNATSLVKLSLTSQPKGAPPLALHWVTGFIFFMAPLLSIITSWFTFAVSLLC